MKTLKLIEFENKLNSLVFNSKYAISSNDINEIKLTINTLVNDILSEDFVFPSFFKYLKIKLPSNIGLTNESALSVYFLNKKTNNLLIIKSDENAGSFFIFKNNKFIDLYSSQNRNNFIYKQKCNNFS